MEEIEEIFENVCVGFKRGQLIISSISEDNRRVHFKTFKDTFFPDGDSYEIGKMVLIHNPWTHNFQHFIDETLPLCIECKDLPEFYVSVWPKFGDDILNFLQIDNVKKFEDNSCFHVERLVRKKIRYIDFRLNEKSDASIPLGYVREKVSNFLDNKKEKTVFIKRDNDKRSCENIDLLISTLKLKFNVDVIENFSDLTVKEKIIILNYYDNVISLYGATSGNVVFKDNGRWLILNNPWMENDKFIKNLNKDLKIVNIDRTTNYLDANSMFTRKGEITENKTYEFNINKCIEKINIALNEPLDND